MALTNFPGFQRAAKTTIYKSLAEYVGSTDILKFVTVVPSDGKTETYEWLGQVAGMSEWLDERQIHAMESFSFTITNRDWEDSVGFDKNVVADTIKSVTPVLQQMAQSAAEHPWELFIELLVANSACFDGQNFFSDTHPYTLGDDNTSNTFDNKLAATGTTEADIRTDFYLVLKQLALYKKRNGRPLFAGRSLGVLDVICHPDQYAFMTLVFEKRDKANESNELFGRARVYQDAGVATGTWYAAVTTKVMKPIILQERQSIEVQAADKDFSNKKIRVGLDARYNVGYGFPQLMISVGV